MRSAKEIVLTGQVLDWNEEPYEENAIEASEADAYERDGFSVVEIGGKLLATKALSPDDGTLTIQPKSSFLGRFAASGGHLNYGLSGYFRAYVFLKGERKRLVDFYALFLKQEHHYAAQQAKPTAEAAIRKRISELAGMAVAKVKGGYAFDPERTVSTEVTE